MPGEFHRAAQDFAHAIAEPDSNLSGALGDVLGLLGRQESRLQDMLDRLESNQRQLEQALAVLQSMHKSQNGGHATAGGQSREQWHRSNGQWRDALLRALNDE